MKYAATGGWGFAQFNDGKSVDAAGLVGCYACHVPVQSRDFVFAHYKP
jgi:Cytochrome P460